MRGHRGIFRVRTSRHGVSHALAGRFDHARALAAQLYGRLRSFIETGSKVDINEIDADSFNLHQHFARPRLRHGQVHVNQILRAADGVGYNSFHLADCMSLKRLAELDSIGFEVQDTEGAKAPGIDQADANAVKPAEAPEQILIDPFISEKIHH